MKNDKLTKLTNYMNHIKDRLSSDTPTKHVKRPKEFKQFLERELITVQKQIEYIKLLGIK